MVQPEAIRPGPDHDTLRTRSLDYRSGRRVTVDEELDLRRRDSSA